MSPENQKSSLVSQAYHLAQESHEGQIRNSGEPYFSHCVAVSKIISEEWGINNDNYIAAALLHDTVEDSAIEINEIKKRFGAEVTTLVEGVTKLNTDSDHRTLAKVLGESYLNPGVAIIKLADRLHNMRTLEFMKPEKQVTKSRETLDVYAKLAESLGMWTVKTELEDLCFSYLNPDLYQQTRLQIDNDPRLHPLFIAHLNSKIEQILSENNFNAHADIRKNGYWALKHKQREYTLKGKCTPDSFKEINDLLSLRIETESLGDCYSLLGLIHQKMGNLVDYNRFDEFIGANKRLNGYEAIQTTLNFPQGPVEISIATKEMEDFNKLGVVSILNSGNHNLQDYTLKLVFTPKGNIKFLPKNATGIDFAGTINSRLLADAHHLNINGQKSELSTVLPQAGVVEVITGPKSRRAPDGPLEDFCALPEIRNMIIEQRLLEKKDNLIESGKQIMADILSKRGLLDFSDVSDQGNSVLFNFGCQDIPDFYVLLANKSINLDELEAELDRAKITKKNLDVSTIQLTGPDSPGILIDVIKIISETGKNITNVYQTNKNNVFNLRLLVHGLTPKEQEKLNQIFKNDTRYSSATVV